MPEIQSESFEVSKEEERYLRRSFRRFALPYLLVFALLGFAVAMTVGGGDAEDAALDATEMQSLIAEAAALRQALGGLRADLDAAAARAEEGVSRVASLEKRVDALADATEAVGAAALRKRIEEAHQRINSLDARLEAVRTAASSRPEPRLERLDPAVGPLPASSGTAGGSWPADQLPR